MPEYYAYGTSIYDGYQCPAVSAKDVAYSDVIPVVERYDELMIPDATTRRRGAAPASVASAAWERAIEQYEESEHPTDLDVVADAETVLQQM